MGKYMLTLARLKSVSTNECRLQGYRQNRQTKVVYRLCSPSVNHLAVRAACFASGEWVSYTKSMSDGREEREEREKRREQERRENREDKIDSEYPGHVDEWQPERVDS
jgi:hypothetical protein